MYSPLLKLILFFLFFFFFLFFVVHSDEIQHIYHLIFKRTFLDSSLQSAGYCKTKFGDPADRCDSMNSLGCSDVLLFWRLQNMLESTVRMLRLESMEYKQELQEATRRVLQDIEETPERKQALISGPRVALAEEIEVLRLLQNKMDQFMKQLKREGKYR
eukprot:m.240629 g.240629  ORF g.240629 m.240629 type:complete len:159 (+) comp15311_c0_seq27:2775-3251(+)